MGAATMEVGVITAAGAIMAVGAGATEVGATEVGAAIAAVAGAGGMAAGIGFVDR